MARLRHEKGRDSQPNTVKSKDNKRKRKAGIDGDLSTEHILAMGGTKADLDLLQGVADVHAGTVASGANTDAALATDVSNFLKDLQLGGHNSKDASKPKHNKGKGKEKESTPKPVSKKPPAKEKTKKSVTFDVDEASPSKPKTKPTHRKGSKKSDPDPTPASTEESKPKPTPIPSKITLNPKSHFTFQPISRWYTALPPLTPTSSSTGPSITPEQLSTLTSKASSLHTADLATYLSSSSSSQGSSSAETSFLSKIIQSGTLSDRLSALTLLVQNSPVHNTKALETLRGMAERGKGKGGREESLKALRCVVDWWVGGGAPDRKLKYFRDQPLHHPSVTDEYLVMWYFEDWLKKYFFGILQILETLSLDPLPYVRTQAITLIFTLLKDKPEQEQNLLRLLVNKLGDTEKPLCSRASHHLLQLLQSHPAMKSVIVREMIGLVLRPASSGPSTALGPTSTSTSAQNKHIRFSDAPATSKATPSSSSKPMPPNPTQTHAKYYSTVTFNQIVLTPSPADREVALKLLDVYFEMFREILGEGSSSAEGGGDDEEAEDEEGEKEVKVDKSGRVIRVGKPSHSKGKGKTKKGRGGKEVRGAAGFTEIEDTHSKWISAILTGVNRALPFARIELGDSGINKHIDTLFLITHTSTFNISLQALVLIQQITASLSSSTAAAQSITDRYYRTLYASLFDPRLASSSKQAMYLNLFFKSVKAAVEVGSSDDDGPRQRQETVKALVRRFVQVLVSGGGGATEFVAGGLYLLGELFSTIPGLRSMITSPPEGEGQEYDPRKRDPQYAHASWSPLWELTPLLTHYHPAVALHARQLLAAQPLTASPDLGQNTLIHFLDRFVYKNPKKVKSAEEEGGKGKGGSAMQPSGSALEGVKLVKGDVEGRVNEKKFAGMKKGDVPVDQLFFHEFFVRKSEREKMQAAKAKKRKGGEDEDEEGDEDEGDEEEEEDEEEGEEDEEVEGDLSSEADESELDEDQVWKAMKASMPKAEGDDDLMLSDEDDDPDEDDDELEALKEGMEEMSDSDESPDSLVEGSDNEDLMPFDGLIEYDGEDEEEEEWGGISQGSKRKSEEEEKGARKKRRALPTFASYEDYAKLIEEGPEDLI